MLKSNAAGQKSPKASEALLYLNPEMPAMHL